MGNINCWEIKKCGRESGGCNAVELGVCPSALDNESNGINHGNNGGRICWAIAGTYCGCEINGDFAQIQASCMACEVFLRIKGEEGDDFILMKPWQAYMLSD